MPATDGDLGVTLATFVYLLRRQGVAVADADVEMACAALDAGGEVAEKGAALVDLVRRKAGGEDVGRVRAALEGIVGAGRVTGDVGEPAAREERVSLVRRLTFGQRRPWLARIADRRSDGSVGIGWVLVEDVGDAVRIMDPNPWDDTDEERELPLGDFLVQWDLAGHQGLRVA